MGARGRSADSDRIDVGREWVAEEMSGCQFPDQRLGSRLHSLMGSLGAQVGSTIPTACEDWASIKAAYRFLSNDRVDEHAILSGHMKATARRIRAADGPILILHDTTEFSYDREDPESIGYTREMPSARKDVTGKTIRYRVCGVMMHSSLAITLQGLPLGLCAVKFWSRKQFKGTQALKNRINPTRIPIEEKESYRWLQNVGQSTALCGDASRCVHIGDREADIYELFCTAHQRGAKFLFRTCVDRLAGDGKHTIADEMAEVAVKGLHQVEFRDKKGRLCHAVLELRYRHIRVRPPTAKQKHYPDLELTVLYARERNVPKGRKPLDWKLITNMPVRSRQQAIEKLDWYAMRWKIETFHKVLKSGCKAEEALLRTADRLSNLIAIYCILIWRILWLTMFNRTSPAEGPELVFTETEMRVLDAKISNTGKIRDMPRSVERYVIMLARLGGYIGRRNDRPPGNEVIWRGMVRLTDIVFSVMLAKRDVGN